MPMSPESDRQARGVLRAAFAQRGMAAPSLPELQAAQAIGRFEGGYGKGWGQAGAGSHNWGAVQCGHLAPCGAGCFEYGDSHADGTGYRGCFKRYDSGVAGAADLLHELYRRDGVPDALRAGDASRIASAMRKSGYFEARADRYAKAIELHASALSVSLGEPHVVVRGGGKWPPPEDPTPEDPTPSPPVLPPPPPPPWGWGGSPGGAGEPPMPAPASDDHDNGGLLATLALLSLGTGLLAWRMSR